MIIFFFLVYKLPRSHNLVLRKPGKLVPFGIPGSNPGRGVALSKHRHQQKKGLEHSEKPRELTSVLFYIH
jgi:hypothetical protein